jgi:peptidoglycan L-alanyl-D-glutamate endopeptidase CwlK
MVGRTSTWPPPTVPSDRPVSSVVPRTAAPQLTPAPAGTPPPDEEATSALAPFVPRVPSSATPAPPIIDSSVPIDRARAHPTAPASITKNQKVLDVTYYGFDRKLHQGQLVVDSRAAADLQAVFNLAVAIRFPIASMIPISEFGWDDDRSMEANNTSGFNYREASEGGHLSYHAFGYAIDLNPRINPYVLSDRTEPPNGSYDPTVPGTLTADHPITKKFKELGWTWGGDWKTVKDYQHFQKPLPAEYKRLRG